MPYKLRKAPKRDLYWVIGEDGSHKSKEPLPKEQAKAQMRALYAAMNKEGGNVLVGGGYFKNLLKEQINNLVDVARRTGRVVEQSLIDEAIRQGNEILKELPKATIPFYSSVEDDDRKTQAVTNIVNDLWTRIRIEDDERKEAIARVEAERIVREAELASARWRREISREWIRTGLRRPPPPPPPQEAPEAPIASTPAPAPPEICPICLDPLGQDSHIGPCLHKIHRQCHAQLISPYRSGPKTGQKVCPVCRYNRPPSLGLDGYGKQLTHKESVLARLGLEEGQSLASLSKASGISKKILQEVYDRGIGAYKTDPISVRMKGTFRKGVNAPMSKKLSKEQWAMARVYSFLDNNPKHDNDLRDGVVIPKDEFIKEHKTLLKVLNKGKPSELKAEARDQAKELEKVVKGGAIQKALLQEMAQSAYPGKTKLNIGNYKLVFSTPTLKFYMNPNKEVVVSIRGTKLPDTDDIAADGLAIVGNLKSSARYKKDLNTLLEFQKKYPQSEYHYIGVGHSLGAAILDGFIRAGLLRNGLSYNGLVEPHELGGNPLHHRIYHKDDPIYKIIGNQIPNVEVRSTSEPFWKYMLEYALPFGLGTLFKAYDRHKLRIFK